MWSKTRQILLSRITPSLQGRVNFVRECFTTKKLKYWSESPVFRITVDGKTWFAEGCYDYWYYIPNRFMQAKLVSNNKTIHPKFSGEYYWNMNEQFAKIGTKVTSVYDGCTRDCIDGKFVIGSIRYAIHLYLNKLSVSQCLEPFAGFCNILALLDYRLGKKKLRKMVDDIEKYPDFWHRWIRLRAQAEGLIQKKV